MILKPAKPETDVDAIELVTESDQITLTASGRVIGGNIPIVMVKDPYGSRLGVT